MQPETEVSIANFWFPAFQFTMTFVPGISRIISAIYKYISGKRKNKNQENPLESNKGCSARKIKFIIGQFYLNSTYNLYISLVICTEAVEILVFLLTLVLFICSLGVTLCVPDGISFDARYVNGIPLSITVPNP